MRISIAHVDASGHVTLTETEVAQGATAADVLARRGIDAGAGIALFGERITPETELHEGDRLDVAAPLLSMFLIPAAFKLMWSYTNRKRNNAAQ